MSQRGRIRQVRSPGPCDDAGLLVEIHEGRDICGVVGLHVLDDEIVRSLVAEDLVDVVKPLVCEMLVHGVEDRALRVENRIRVVGHPVGDGVLALEKVNLVVVNAYVADVVCNLHRVEWIGGNRMDLRVEDGYKSNLHNLAAQSGAAMPHNGHSVFFRVEKAVVGAGGY